MTYVRQIAHLKNMVNNIYLKVIFNNFEWHKENNFINLKVLMCVLITFVILPNQHKSQKVVFILMTKIQEIEYAKWNTIFSVLEYENAHNDRVLSKQKIFYMQYVLTQFVFTIYTTVFKHNILPKLWN